MNLLPVILAFGLLPIILPAILSAQTLYPVQRDGKWGYIDSTGTVVIPLEYDRVRQFQGEYAPVLINERWGVINKSGEWFMRPQFDGLEWRDRGVLSVLEGVEEFYSTLDGRRLTEKEFYLWRDDERRRFFSLNPDRDAWSFIKSLPGNLWENRRRIEAEGKYGFVDSADALMIPLRYDYVQPFYHGLAPVNIGAQVEKEGLWEWPRGGLWGVIDSTGKTVVPILYDEVDISSDGQIISVQRQDQYTLYLRDGNLLIGSNYAGLAVVNDSMIVATYSRDEKGEFVEMRKASSIKQSLPIIRSGLLSFSGDTLLPFDYESIYAWDSDRFIVKDFSGSRGVISLREGLLIENKFESLNVVDSNILVAGIPDSVGRGRIALHTPGGFINTAAWYTLIDSRGTQILPGRWRKICRLYDSLSLFEVVDEVKGRGVLHLDGRVIVPQDWYSSIMWRDGLIELVRDTCSFRLINPDGSAAIDRCFLAIEDYAPEATFITVGREGGTGDEKGLIDSSGKIKALFGYDKFSIRSLDKRFNEGLMRVRYRADQVEFINEDGVVVLGPYKWAERFSEGLAAVAVPDQNDPERDRYGFVDREGKMVVSPQFDSVGFFREGLAPVGKLIDGDMKWGFIDRKGKWVVKPRFGYARPFSDGLAAVLQWTDSGMVIEAWGCLVASERYDRIGSWGAIDRKGRIVIPTTLDYLYDFYNGAASADADSGYGIIDRKGHWLASPRFSWVGEFTGTLAPATVGVMWYGEATDGGIGYIGRDGNWVIAPRFQQAEAFSNGRAAVQDDEACRDLRYVDAEGKIVWQE